jgi:hypothetical protein
MNQPRTINELQKPGAHFRIMGVSTCNSHSIHRIARLVGWTHPVVAETDVTVA